MGHGGYSYEGRQSRSISQGYTTKSREELFPSRSINSDMNPKGVTIRESRDSEEHPNSVALILGLDVTRSMGIVPHELLKDGLPKIFSTITEAGVQDLQLMFVAIGDHYTDEAPLQISQFERQMVVKDIP